MNSKVIGMVVVVLVVVAGAFVLVKNKNTAQPVTTQNKQQAQQPTIEVSPTEAMMVSGTVTPGVTGMEAKGSVKEFTVTGSSFKFVPATLSVKKGDKVKITFKNSGGMHDFVIDELGVKSPVIQSGKESIIEFTAAKAGKFEYYCSVGNHRQMGMVGTITVAE